MPSMVVLDSAPSRATLSRSAPDARDHGAGTSAWTLAGRDQELQAIESAIGRATAEGHRALVVVEGPAGIGKTALLGAARDLAVAAGASVLTASGSALEADFSYGVVHQFVDPVSGRSPDELSRHLLSWSGEFTLERGLFAFAMQMTVARPLVLIVDDLQWADQASVRALRFLAARLASLPVALVVSVTPAEGEADSPALIDLCEQPGTVRLAPSVLAEDDIATVLASDFGSSPAPAFVSTCLVATGGNPYLVRELALALRVEGIDPTAEAAQRIRDTAPPSVARSMLARVGRLSADAARLAQAIAVLGPDSNPCLARKLAALDRPAATEALDVLRCAGVLDGTRFRHPMVRTAVYEHLTAARRSLMHGLAAEILITEGSSLGAIAAHLIRTEPLGSQDTSAILCHAAEDAMRLGTPAAAVRYLRRALQEGADRAHRATMLLALGRAEARSGLAEAAASFAAVPELTADAAPVASAALARASLLADGPDPAAAIAVLDGAGAVFTGADAVTAAAIRVTVSMDLPHLAAEQSAHNAELRELAAGPDGQLLTLALTASDTRRGISGAELPPTVVACLDPARLGDGTSLMTIWRALETWFSSGRLDVVRELQKLTAARATSSGCARTQLLADALQVALNAELGRLDAAAQLMPAVIDRALAAGMPALAASVLWHGVDAILERPELAGVAQIVEMMAPVRGFAGAQLADVQARIQLARGGRDEHASSLRAAAAVYTALGIVDPHSAPAWRLTDIDVTQDIETLEQVVERQRSSPNVLAQARALTWLGAALRRQRHATASREPLRQALDLASRCGATKLVAQIRTELAAAGGRPRRDRETGYDALTTSERRVAEHAAAGRSNHEIAELLFVTSRTVESHLHRIYRKLDINTRKQLTEALATEALATEGVATEPLATEPLGTEGPPRD